MNLTAPKKRNDNNFYFTPVFHCCFWIRNPRSGIRDKHPGSATLQGENRGGQGGGRHQEGEGGGQGGGRHQEGEHQEQIQQNVGGRPLRLLLSQV